MITAEFNLQGMSPTQLQHAIEMTRDALAFHQTPESEATPEDTAKLERLLAAYQDRLGRWGNVAERDNFADDEVTVGRKAGSRAANQYGSNFTVEPASEKQIYWVKKLAQEKDLSGTPTLGPITIPTDIDSLSKKSATTLLDRLFAAPNKGAAAQVAAGPSEKQIALITKLYGEKDWAGVIGDFDVDTNQPVPDLSTLTPGREGTASKLIDALFAAPRKQVQRQAEKEWQAGAYITADGRVIRVYLGQQSGKMLSTELVDATSTDRDVAWNYLGLASKNVPADARLMTPEEAEAASAGNADHGWCCVCGRELDVPESVARGIGPVCRARLGG